MISVNMVAVMHEKGMGICMTHAYIPVLPPAPKARLLLQQSGNVKLSTLVGALVDGLVALSWWPKCCQPHVDKEVVK